MYRRNFNDGELISSAELISWAKEIHSTAIQADEPHATPSAMSTVARESEGVTPPVQPSSDPPRDSNKPGRDRQDDILATIRSAGTPLMRPELIEAMKLKTEGKLGANLAWMVKNNFLVNIPQRGYWPVGELVPK